MHHSCANASALSACRRCGAVLVQLQHLSHKMLLDRPLSGDLVDVLVRRPYGDPAEHLQAL